MDLLSNANRSLTCVGRWLFGLPTWIFLLLVFGVVVAKTTIVWRFELIDATSRDFPSEVGFGSSNLIGIAIHRSVNGSSTWYAVAATAALVGAALVVWRLGAPRNRGRYAERIMIVLAASWPLVLADIAWLGNGFELLPLFIALAILAKRTVIYWTAAILAALTHPEQTFLAFGCLTALSFAPEFRRLRTRGMVGLGAAGIAVITTSVWISASGGQSRSTYFFDWFLDSGALFLRNAALIVYSGWGVWWLVLFLGLASVGIRARWLILVTAIVIPSAITATTIDGTRVFTGVSSAVGIALIAWLGATLAHGDVPQEDADSANSALLGLVAIAFLVLPNLQVAMWGEFPGPGDFWINTLRLWVPM